MSLRRCTICDAELSSYNPKKICFRHQPSNFPIADKKEDFKLIGKPESQGVKRIRKDYDGFFDEEDRERCLELASYKQGQLNFDE